MCPAVVYTSPKILLGPGVGVERGGGRDSRRDPGTGQLQAVGSEQLSMLGAGDASLTVLASGH